MQPRIHKAVGGERKIASGEQDLGHREEGRRNISADFDPTEKGRRQRGRGNQQLRKTGKEKKKVPGPSAHLHELKKQKSFQNLKNQS